MKLKTHLLNFETEGPLIVILNEKDSLIIDVEPLGRIRIRKGNKEVIAAVDISRGGKHIPKGTIGVFLDVAEKLNIKENQIIEIKLEPKPYSLNYIKKKLDNNELNKTEIEAIIKDLVNNKLTEIETTYFVSACYVHGLTLSESAYLTEAIVKSSSIIKFSEKNIFDVHSVGGTAGNRTSPIIVSIIAAAGLKIPKTATRAITSPSGTADCFEVLAPVEHTKEEIKKIVEKTNGCIVWGGTLDLAAADDKLIRLEKILNIDPEGILLASILSKKSAVNSDRILIEILYGKEAKIKSLEKAKNLAKKFSILGKKLGMKIETILNEGSSPVGKGIGPALEAIDVLLVLQNKGPEDLKKKSLHMASLVLKISGIKNPKETALNLLKSGRAYEKLKEIIKAQGGDPDINFENIKLGKFTYGFKSKNSGKINFISNILVTKIAKLAGAPEDKGAGIYLNKSLNENVRKGEVLFKIYAENKEKLNYALKEHLDRVYEIFSK